MIKLIRDHYLRRIRRNFGSRTKRAGQISILIIMSLIPLFTLFAFVVNLGMLVNAKIALQNAADLAAISGAAAQARQLTAISHMNYMMRHTYKRFLSRFYGMGNYLLACYPKNGVVPASYNGIPCTHAGKGLTSKDQFDFINPGPAGFPGTPVVCLSENPENNPCQLGDKVKVVQKPTCIPGLNPVCDALSEAAEQIGQIQGQVCKNSEFLNFEIASKWLYGGELDNKVTLTSTAGVLDSYASGLGLVPEQVMNHSRIKTLQSYVNEPSKEVDKKRIGVLEGQSPDLAAIERTVLAYKTALGNLNKNVFNNWDYVTMTELMPDAMLSLESVKAIVELPVVLFKAKTGADIKNCALDLYRVGGNPFLAVYKRPESMDVFYAIKLRAKARLLFNPFPLKGQADPEGVELVAYSAAKPFGSRIGPQVSAEDFAYPRKVQFTSYDENDNPVQVKYDFSIPYLKMQEDSPPIRTDSIGVLANMGSFLDLGKTLGTSTKNDGRVYTPNSIFDTTSNIATMFMWMQFPDAIELGNYNIPVDTERDAYELSKKTNAPKSGMVSYFGDKTLAYYKLWAPLVAPAQGGSENEITEIFKTEIEQGFSATQTATGGLPGAAAALSQEFIEKLTKRLGEMRAQNNSRVVHIVDPLSRAILKNSSNLTVPQIIGKSMETENTAYYATSYTTPNDSDYYAAGRDGYSVKLIPFSIVSKLARGKLPGSDPAEVSALRH